MSVRRTIKASADQQKALDLYVRRPEPLIVTPPPSGPTPDIVTEGLEVMRPEGMILGDDTPVSSEDVREAMGILDSSPGSLGDEAVDPALDVEPFLEAATEAAEAAPAGEDELLLDAWHAEFSDAGQRAALLVAQAALRDNVLEVVIGTDERVRITNLNGFPWRAICSLKITARDGSPWIGTGWLIGRRTLITAGHCVYIHSRGGWASKIEVIPGRNGSEQPFGSCVSSSFRSVAGWTERQQRANDYAAIILPENCPFGDRLGFFGVANLDDAALNQMRVNLSGYPGDKPSGTQWFHSLQIKAVNSTSFSYDIDTAGGQSGAPVWRLQNGVRHAVGIHTNGSLTGNSATRINKTVFDNLMLWKGEGD